MSDPLLDVTDAIVVALNAHDFGDNAPEFTAERRFQPIMAMAKEEAGVVFVRAVPVNDVAIGKNCVQGDFTVRIFVQEKLTARDEADEADSEDDDDAAFASMMAFVGDMRTFLLMTPIVVGGVNLWCSKAARAPAFDMPGAQAREFLALIEGNWRSFG